MSKWKTIDVDPFTLPRACPACSPAAALDGAATVVQAVNAGKEAAISIDRYLSNVDIKEGRVKYWTKGLADKDITEMSDELGIAEAKLHARLAEKSEEDLKDVEKAPRVHMKHLDPMVRRTNYDEVIAGMSEEDAKPTAA